MATMFEIIRLKIFLMTYLFVLQFGDGECLNNYDARRFRNNFSDILYLKSGDFNFNQTDSEIQLSQETAQHGKEPTLPSTGKCPNNQKCVKCRVRTAPNPTDPNCTCCGNPKQCLHQHLCVPMELFCSKGHYLRYSDKENAHICFPCPLGQYCNHRYCRYKCMSCNVGHEAAESGATQCTPCRKGFFKAELTGVECQECPYGYSTNNTGAEECTAEDGIGIDEPLECDQTQCIPCENFPGNASLTHPLCACCPQGMCSYREKCNQFKIACEHGVLKNENSSFCEFCPRGTYCDEQFCSTCRPCSAGSEKLVNTYGKCQLCKPGYFKADEGTQMCSTCPTGHYNVFSGSLSCIQCPIGHFCPSTTQPPFICPNEYNCPAGTSFPQLKKTLKEDISMKVRMYAPPSNTFSWLINKSLLLINLYFIYLIH